jgi:Hydrazine synthase alpha subunit middle domain
MIASEVDMKVQSKVAWRLVFWGAIACGAALAGCTSGDNTASSTVTVAGDVPIAYAMRVNTVTLNPLTANPFAAGGDLIIREKSSPSAPEHNITTQFTQGKGDVADPSVSFDGKKIVFAMNCPASNTSTIGGQPACTGHWNIWEYDMTSGGLTGGTFRRITNSSDDDVAPGYLPGGTGFVFASNRQTKSSVVSAANPQGQALGHSYKALDEYEREVVSNLHTMDLNGGNIQQISFNQSHDRNPVVRPDGTILYSRWDHVGDRNRFTVFTTKPDGTGLFVLYGAHNSVNSFLHPRDMDPNGPYKGFLASDAMPLDRTQEGGALMFIDAADYSEENTPANSTIPAQGGQTQPTTQALNFGSGLSLYGRVTSPFPLRDGTNRVLVAYASCEVTRSGVVVPCATLSQAEIARLSMQNRLIADVQADPLQNNVPPSYAIYMYDPKAQTWLIVAAPPAGFMYDHPVPIMATTEPSVQPPTSVDATLAAQGLGVLDVQSVYDTDGLGRMGDAILNLNAGSFDARSCATPIAKTTPLDSLDTRPLVADLVRIKDPASPAYQCAPARLVRVLRAVAPPSGMTGTREAIGDTEFEMQQLLGYAPIEPDGSFKLNVPADTPIGLQVVDAEGRAFQMHTNWIQVRPGERRTCDGCHSPRRGAALNSGTVVNSVPAAWLPAMASAHQPGDTMAATRTRMDPAALNYSADQIYTDIWAGPSQARASISVKYTGNAPSGGVSNDLSTTAPTNGIINYPDHIQPIWDAHGCNSANCHSANDPVGLNLAKTTAGTGRLVSYESLLVGTPMLDASGKPVTTIEDGVLVIQRNPALVIPTGSEGDAVGVARKSRLTEIMWGESLMTDAASQAAHPNPPASPNHATMLNAAEKRVLAEWMDLAAKYYNDPFNASSGVRAIAGLSADVFKAQIEPILMKTCAAYCHQGVGSNQTKGGSQTPPPGTTFVDNKLVLTGSLDANGMPTGDFNVVLTMISDACNPANNLLLSKPSTIPHPTGATSQTTAVLPVGSADYNTIASWIQAGCTP